MFSQRRRKVVGTVISGDKIKVANIRGIKSSFNRSKPGLAIGVGGRPQLRYVLYGVLVFKSSLVRSPLKIFNPNITADVALERHTKFQGYKRPQKLAVVLKCRTLLFQSGRPE
jgi:hypothetical protein